MNTDNQTYHSKAEQGSEQSSLELRLLSINEARKLMGIRYETLKKLVYDGKIEVIEIEGRIKIPHMNLIKFQQRASKLMMKVKQIYNTSENDDDYKTKLKKILNNN